MGVRVRVRVGVGVRVRVRVSVRVRVRVRVCVCVCNVCIDVKLRPFIILSKEVLEVKLPTIWTDEKQSRAEEEKRGE